ncbi:MAG: glycosyltransferase family 4 protein [Ilumatobacteraceae bacterium]
MRVVMVSWEYPPLLIGGIASHAEGLATAMAPLGTRSWCSPSTTRMRPRTRSSTACGCCERIDLPWIPDEDLVAQMASANHQLVQLAAALGGWRPEVVHSHDWMVGWAGDTLKTLWGVPLVATIHATERGRHGGHVPPGLPAVINAAEWWLTYQATEVICCSAFMRRETVEYFELPADKVHLVPNGVEPSGWTPPAPPPSAARSWWHGVGSSTKGLPGPRGGDRSAARSDPGPAVRDRGAGSYLPELQMQVDVEGVGDLVHLAGFVPDDQLRSLLHQASCAVIPSLYEPFGIVALGPWPPELRWSQRERADSPRSSRAPERRCSSSPGMPLSWPNASRRHSRAPTPSRRWCGAPPIS